TVTAEGGYTRERASAAQAPGVPRDQRDVNLDHAATDVSWELDLFGRVRRNVEASRADASAIAADLQALQVSVAAEVARNYFELRGAQEQLRVAQRNADNQRKTLELTQDRLDAGRGTEFDTSRSRAELESTLARIPALEATIATAMHRLAVLDGRQPGELNARLQAPVALPALPQTVAVGTPNELLRRRPDIQAAERRLASATARVGVATADLFPRVTFGGSVGVSATNLGDLFTRDGENYAFGPAISWVFLDLGRVRARISAADASSQANLASYEGTVLRALEEAENALVAYSRAQREGEHLKESAVASQSAAKLADIRFEGGASDFLQVLDAQRSELQAEDQLAQSQTRTAVALVAVYKSVSGGWPQRTLASKE
ncbi:MAG TPA: efflux transporter outer membrane subunit, partial [Nevskiaceae bacterium]|nr:efflux transporter outer membrane subunit [Nevskiaceae bacterium]